MAKRRTFLSTVGSALFDKLFSDMLAEERRKVMRNPFSVTNPALDVATPPKVDSALLRRLYRNTDNSYSMAAHLVKPIIDSNCSFIGVPAIRSANGRTLSAIEKFKKKIPFHQVHRIAEREGTAFVWPQIGVDGELRFVVLRPETVEDICIDPVSKEVVAYRIVDQFSYKSADGNSHNMKTTVVVDANKIVTTNETDVVALVGTKTVRNVFGFIPIVRFVNDAEPWEVRGHSEIENIEPQLKWYNDISVEAGRAQKRDGHPKMMVRARDPEAWVDNNFGIGTWAKLTAGQASLRIDDRDFFVCQAGETSEEESETVSYIEANRTTGEYTTLSEKSFTNIIEGAQTPEIIMGANMGTSLASVREQRPAYIKKIERKQFQYEESWRQVITVALDILGTTTFHKYDSNNFNFVWPTPDFASAQEKASTLNTLSTSLIKAKEAHIIGDKEIFNTLKNLDILKIEQDIEEHEKDIEDTAKKMVERTEDARAKQDNNMNQRIANGDYDNTAVNDDKAEEDDADEEKK